MSGPFDAFLSRAVSDCVNAVHESKPLPSLEVLPEGSTCPDCGANVSLPDYCEECEASK